MAEDRGTRLWQFPDHVYLNFTAMHGIQHVVDRISSLAEESVTPAERPPLSWFEAVARADSPDEVPPRELPFRVYLITGNAGSGKSTCIQALTEMLNCVTTGSTRVAALNVFTKLSSAYTSPAIQTIFHDFGFKGSHVQAVLGKFKYPKQPDPKSLVDAQMSDLYYYWDVLKDIANKVVEGGLPETMRVLLSLELKSGKPFTDAAPFLSAATPALIRSNVVLIDEAGVLGKHILTAVVFSWWLHNALWQTRRYAEGKVPVIVCIGSPTQTDAMESVFEHSTLRHLVSNKTNILSHLIRSSEMAERMNLNRNWTIFINNKRCTEQDFGNVLKAFEFGLPMNEGHARFLDQFVVSESYIKDPSKLPGWTRLFASHDDVKVYMSRLHANLRARRSDKFKVFVLPIYTVVSLEAFDKYKELTGQTSLTMEKWLTANASRLGNYSQSRDLDVTTPRFEYGTADGKKFALITTDASHVLNSQISVTKRVKKLVFGFEGSFGDFAAVLSEDTFFKKHGEDHVEFAYRFIAALLFSGMIAFYDFLRTEGLPQDKVDAAYSRLQAVTADLLAATHEQLGIAAAAGAQTGSGARRSRNADAFAFDDDASEEVTDAELDDLFGAMTDNSMDAFYLNYEKLPADAHGQEIFFHFDMLKRLFSERYDALSGLFGKTFTSAPFRTFVGQASFNGSNAFVSSFSGGILSFTSQTDAYTLRGVTRAPVPCFVDELFRGRDWAAAILRETDMPRVVVSDSMGFVSVINHNMSTFVDNVSGEELQMAATVDHGISSNLAMTITRSQGLGLDRVAICFATSQLKLNTAYVAMSRVTSCRYLRMNVNPLRTHYEDTRRVSAHILAALRCKDVKLVY
ncbi:helicase primase subunit [Psittacid alphaherpesvirus 1]|uniref:DNA replication helicase n=1 Tax=Psittacid herpesvirus 1 (isolate Amazon parrot/-/97-0001/1997) TaxID=670426 RepID=HELI_PSHV1|nr:helicase-primase helicase subunit [Psittacid alphaherpesvirus 1]Q6UDG9.1 RecName: Full=DNA replication helicase [Psittacid herpesvirus 1 Amazon parrot/1997]AAQ73741.1 helicase primase subunit [Psittacid alphaherpesvirus 1]